MKPNVSIVRENKSSVKDDEIFLNWKQEKIGNEPHKVSTKMKPQVSCPSPGVLGEKSVFAVVLGDYLVFPLGPTALGEKLR